jgi:hypothetical protein
MLDATCMKEITSESAGSLGVAAAARRFRGGYRCGPPGDFTREKLRPRPQNRVLALQDLMRSLVYDAREKNFSLTRNIPQRDDPALVPGEFDNSQRIGKGCDVADDAYGTGGVAWM